MPAVAPLSYTSQTGYYGLRVNPTFDEVLNTVKNPLRIPVPSRAAKWYALSPYRALILNAEARYNDYEHAKLDYRSSGAQLPESAANVRESDAGYDPSFDELDRHHHDQQSQHAYEAAYDAMRAQDMQHTAEARTTHLGRAYGSNRMHPVVEAAHEELTEAGVPHAMPGPRIAPEYRPYRAPLPQMQAKGQPQAPEFPTFEHLNMGQPLRFTRGRPTVSQNMTYERAREFVVGPTWSS